MRSETSQIWQKVGLHANVGFHNTKYQLLHRNMRLTIFDRWPFLMVLDVLAIYYRFTKTVSPPTVFKIFGPNLARLLKIYVPKKVWSEIVTFFTFGPSAALFWADLSFFSSKRPKNGEKWAAKGPKLGNMKISDHTFLVDIFWVIWPSLGKKSWKM